MFPCVNSCIISHVVQVELLAPHLPYGKQTCISYIRDAAGKHCIFDAGPWALMPSYYQRGDDDLMRWICEFQDLLYSCLEQCQYMFPDLEWKAVRSMEDFWRVQRMSIDAMV